MNITREALQDALRHLVVQAKTTIPVLAFVKVEPGRLASTDLDIHTAVAVQDTAPDPPFLAPLAALKSAAKGKGPNGIIRIVPKKIELPDKSTISFAAPRVDEFPAWPAFEAPAPTVDLPGAFVDAASMATRIATHHDTRYYLNGALLEADPETNTITIVATDGHRLFFLPFAQSIGRLKKWPTRTLIQAQGLRWLARQDPSDTITVAAGDKLVFLKSGRHSAFVRTLDGQFPTWKRVVPVETPHVTAFVREDLLRVVTSAMTAANPRTHGIDFTLSADRTAVEAKNGDDTAYATTLNAKTLRAGKREFRLRVDAAYVLDFLRGTDVDIVTLAFDTPVKLKHSDPTGTLIQNATVWRAGMGTYVLMPLRA